jgi:hypothetical protein
MCSATQYIYIKIYLFFSMTEHRCSCSYRSSSWIYSKCITQQCKYPSRQQTCIKKKKKLMKLKMQLSPGWKLSTQSAPKLPQTEFLRLLVKHGAHGVRSSRKTKILYDKIHCLLLQIFVIINKDFSRFARWRSKKMGLLETHMIQNCQKPLLYFK